jgi:urocanate hydratase
MGPEPRSWAQNEHSIETGIEFNNSYRAVQITRPYLVGDGLVDDVVDRRYKRQ